MQTYIAILRGINVSGQKIIKMAELRTHLSSLGFSNLSTYIQTGNIIFKSTTQTNAALEKKIHQNIKEHYGFDVPVIVRTKEEWEKVVDRFPYNLDAYDINRLAVVYLKENPIHIPEEEIDKFRTPNDEVVYEEKEIYLYMPDGFGVSKLTNNVFERKLKVAATSRNWKTTMKLLELSKNLE